MEKEEEDRRRRKMVERARLCRQEWERERERGVRSSKPLSALFKPTWQGRRHSGGSAGGAAESPEERLAWFAHKKEHSVRRGEEGSHTGLNHPQLNKNSPSESTKREASGSLCLAAASSTPPFRAAQLVRPASAGTVRTVSLGNQLLTIQFTLGFNPLSGPHRKRSASWRTSSAPSSQLGMEDFLLFELFFFFTALLLLLPSFVRLFFLKRKYIFTHYLVRLITVIFSQHPLLFCYFIHFHLNSLISWKFYQLHILSKHIFGGAPINYQKQHLSYLFKRRK